MSNLQLITQSQSFLFGEEPFQDGTLYNLLYRISARETQDPRDYVFGIMGLVGPKARSLIPIDYGASVSAVITNAVVVACLTTHYAWFWCTFMEECFNRSGPGIKDLPSWCPDFTILMDAWNDMGREEPDISDEVRRTLAKDGDVIIDEKNRTLRALGVRLDTIKESIGLANGFAKMKLYKIWEKGDSSDGDSQDDFALIFNEVTSEWLNRMSEVFYSKFGKENGAPEALVQIFHDRSSQSPPYEMHMGLDEIRAFCEWSQAQNVETWQEAEYELGLHRSVLDQIKDDLTSVLIEQHGRQFFLTSAGRVGFAPVETSAGDIVCYINGGRRLHILSSDGNRHITCASVKGLTSNEILAMSEDWKDKWETFVLT